ncbi:protein-tyrosine phosphatase family protein [Desulforhopalus singaporensis]|uniref:Dual specificity phosphatase, catalytic domain n=1 Tax=Desulforhopalus singaporensis TaxID=91360 RepID=A0A1H0QCN4_9BACT|nr:dual specificity protein phosphatase [Desulforhopalus singaporensis]SDP14970.1 Dual specificity phosphatase, catalytic domain [Desulforhopalus singaporensis]
MSEYLVTWITDNLAVGHAPMSYADLNSIKAQGIDGIINLCYEFCDLHELEEYSGFEVYYLPVMDEQAPEMDEMEKALEWLDESVYLGKKILVHCRHGIGRTGTLVTAYLLRRGLGIRRAEKLLKKTRANPTNFSQWRLLRKYSKKETRLKIGKATPQNRKETDLSLFYERYERLLKKIDRFVTETSPAAKVDPRRQWCNQSFSLAPIEAIYLHDYVNRKLSVEQRKQIIETIAAQNIRPGHHSCPLFQGDRCLLHQYRPIRCRIGNAVLTDAQMTDISLELTELSAEIFRTLFHHESELPLPSVEKYDVISGKFLQKYFQFLTRITTDEQL